MTLYVVITARCSSGRFPNKAISNLGGKPMIEQIIIKAKKFKNIDGIVLSTSTLWVDDALRRIAEANDIGWYRGSNDELADRHIETWNMFGITHALTLSGDSPFFDLEIAQRLINAMREKPQHWVYGAYTPYGCPVSGHSSTGLSRKCIEAQVKAYKSCSNRDEIQECYAQAHVIPDGDPRYLRIDCSDIMPPTKTAMKIDIDYPLEMAVMNKVIDYLGYFPEKYEDIEKAFLEIKRL